MALVFLPGDLLGVGMGYPGKMVTMTLDGVPRGTRYPIGEPAEGFQKGEVSVTPRRVAVRGPASLLSLATRL